MALEADSQMWKPGSFFYQLFGLRKVFISLNLEYPPFCSGDSYPYFYIIIWIRCNHVYMLSSVQQGGKHSVNFSLLSKSVSYDWL